MLLSEKVKEINNMRKSKKWYCYLDGAHSLRGFGLHIQRAVIDETLIFPAVENPRVYHYNDFEFEYTTVKAWKTALEKFLSV
jgi:hypothetical protein